MPAQLGELRLKFLAGVVEQVTREAGMNRTDSARELETLERQINLAHAAISAQAAMLLTQIENEGPDARMGDFSDALSLIRETLRQRDELLKAYEYKSMHYVTMHGMELKQVPDEALRG